MAGEDGYPEYHSAPRTVRTERLELKVRKDYLRYFLRISEFRREYYVLQNTDKYAELSIKTVYSMRTRTGSETTGCGCAAVAVGLL